MYCYACGETDETKLSLHSKNHRKDGTIQYRHICRSCRMIRYRTGTLRSSLERQKTIRSSEYERIEHYDPDEAKRKNLSILRKYL